jgi:enoyl-CoA hydratase/carnithine racemase
MILTGDLITSQAAKDINLVSQICEDDELMKESIALAESIASASPPAVRASLKTLRMRITKGLDVALQREADSQAHCYQTPEFAEGLQAIIEKRRPKF